MKYIPRNGGVINFSENWVARVGGHDSFKYLRLYLS